MTRVHEITTGMGRTYVLDFSCGEYTVANTTAGKYEAMQNPRTEAAGLDILRTLRRRETAVATQYQSGETPHVGDTVRSVGTVAWPEGRIGKIVRVFDDHHQIHPGRALVRWIERKHGATRMARIDPGKLTLIEPAIVEAGAA